MMKLSKKEIVTFSLKEISKMYNISISTLKYRCPRLGFIPEHYNGGYEYRLTSEQVEKLVETKRMYMPEIIYVTRTIEIYESKMNYEKT